MMNLFDKCIKFNASHVVLVHECCVSAPHLTQITFPYRVARRRWVSTWCIPHDHSSAAPPHSWSEAEVNLLCVELSPIAPGLQQFQRSWDVAKLSRTSLPLLSNRFEVVIPVWKR